MSWRPCRHNEPGEGRKWVTTWGVLGLWAIVTGGCSSACHTSLQACPLGTVGFIQSRQLKPSTGCRAGRGATAPAAAIAEVEVKQPTAGLTSLDQSIPGSLDPFGTGRAAATYSNTLCGQQRHNLLDGAKWRQARVVSAGPVSLDGSIWRLRLEPFPSIMDLVSSSASRQPGQSVGVSVGVEDEEGKELPCIRMVLPVASPPTRKGDALRCPIEVLVDWRHEFVVEGGSRDELYTRVRDLEEGDVVEVTPQLGQGFLPYLGRVYGLGYVLKGDVDVLIVAKGAAGVAAAASVMNWYRMDINARKRKVTVVTEIQTILRNPLMDRQDEWRSFHSPYVKVVPVLSRPTGDSNQGSAVEATLFSSNGLNHCLGVKPERVTVLIAGFPREERVRLMKRLVAAGVSTYRIMGNDMRRRRRVPSLDAIIRSRLR